MLTRDPDGQPFEVFLNVGKAGSETFASAEALGNPPYRMPWQGFCGKPRTDPLPVAREILLTPKAIRSEAMAKTSLTPGNI